MHIFISYAKKETYELAIRLRNRLSDIDGLTVWIDESLTPAASWAEQIQNEIKRCQLMIVLLSPDVNRPQTEDQPRSFVLNEIDYAQMLRPRKPIIPVMAQKTELPLQIAGTQYIDLTRNQAAGLEQLVNEVCRKTGVQTPAEKKRAADLERQHQEKEIARLRQEVETLRGERELATVAPTLATTQLKRKPLFRRRKTIIVLILISMMLALCSTVALAILLSNGDDQREDRDGDGIANSRDDCPTLAGQESAQGCPDNDGDGIENLLDACPNRAFYSPDRISDPCDPNDNSMATVEATELPTSEATEAFTEAPVDNTKPPSTEVSGVGPTATSSN